MEQRPEPTDKRDWRDQMRARRRGVPPLLRLAEGRRAAVHLACWPSLPRNSMVATYLSLPDEFPTDSVNSVLQEQGCRLAVPAWYVQEKFYRFASWRPKEPLMAGPMRVPEPRLKRWIPTETIALFLVPGLAFDLAGGRIGYGQGFYDRLLLGRRESSLCMGLGYDWQVVEQVPQGPGDIRMAWIATPRGVSRAVPVTGR